MAVQLAFFDDFNRLSSHDAIWCTLYSSLRPYILSWIYSSGVSSWQGQEHDLADDILQEAVIRTLRYSKQTETGAANPIYSMICFGRTVAQNHFRDLRRRELRLVRPMAQENQEPMLLTMPDAEIDPAEVALEDLSRFSLMLTLAHIIKEFPSKQRIALLIDIAKYTDFEDGPSPLQIAFKTVGINLHNYRFSRSTDPNERARHAASLSVAYKRLRQVFLTDHRDDC